MIPLIRRCDSNGVTRYWCVTRYTVGADGSLDAHARFDITDQILPLVDQAARDAIRKAAAAVRVQTEAGA
jgi:hypothetical protein